MRPIKSFHLFLFMLFNCDYVPFLAEGHSITVATYNIWNIMFNWDVRKLRITQMVKEHLPDVIVFQEVRADGNGKRNQIQDLQNLLRMYPYKAFAGNNDVIPMKDVFFEGWEKEGIGMLSRRLIVNQTSWPLAYHMGPDKNHRLVLHAVVDAGAGELINILVAHFSYDRQQQCGNAEEISSYIERNKLTNVILLGDFNTYKDYDFPLHILSQADGKKENFCPKASQRLLALNSHVHLLDAWTQANPKSTGYSFSNMPIPGLESRPDRIFISDTFSVQSASLHGDGKVYKERFFYHIMYQRLEDLLGAMLDSYRGHQGRSCMYDCGPHASCRCGLCVAIGDQDSCLLPECEECKGEQFLGVLVVFVVFILMLIHLIYSLLQVLHTMNQETQRTVLNCLGIHCCLLNQALYTNTTRHHRRHSMMRKISPCTRLPPMVLTVVCLLGILFLTEATILIFDKAISDIYGILPEEMYPSDHLMLIATLQWDS